MKKKSVITWIVIIAVVAFAIFILNKPQPLTDEEFAKCLGENSELYTQAGCHACEIQENMFGETYQYLNIIDCVLEKNWPICQEADIRATPTWIINGQKYVGVQSIETLKQATGCE